MAKKRPGYDSVPGQGNLRGHQQGGSVGAAAANESGYVAGDNHAHGTFRKESWPVGTYLWHDSPPKPKRGCASARIL